MFYLRKTLPCRTFYLCAVVLFAVLACSSGCGYDEGTSSQGEHCRDGIDNDGDGLTDCRDPDCSFAENCQQPPKETLCGDDLDNDGDGLVDCADPDCVYSPECVVPTELSCTDGQDNDDDGLTDCDDPDCEGSEACTPFARSCRGLQLCYWCCGFLSTSCLDQCDQGSSAEVASSARALTECLVSSCGEDCDWENLHMDTVPPRECMDCTRAACQNLAEACTWSPQGTKGCQSLMTCPGYCPYPSSSGLECQMREDLRCFETCYATHDAQAVALSEAFSECIDVFCTDVCIDDVNSQGCSNCVAQFCDDELDACWDDT